MELTQDLQHNIAYIRFRQESVAVETIRISDELNLDIAADGRVYGIELLNAKDQLGHLLVVDLDSASRHEIPLSHAG